MPAIDFKSLKVFSLRTLGGFRFCRLDIRYFRGTQEFQYPKQLTVDESDLLDCLAERRLHRARNLLHRMAETRSQRRRVVYWTSLLTKYWKDGFVDEARVLFEIMPERNIVSYNAMLSGYVECGRLGEARRLFEEMPERNVVSWTSMLCGLGNAGMIREARRLFEEMPERNVVSWNAMLVGLARNGDLDGARRVFDDMPVKNVVSWNAMVAAYVESGRIKEARFLFDQMQERNLITWTSMITGYCRVGDVEEGYYLFRRIQERNVVSWTAMIGGFSWNGFYEEALLLYLEMTSNSDIRPNRETIISLAYACAGMEFCHLGKQLHTQVIANGFKDDDYDGRLCKSLVHMYSSFGVMDYAHYIFESSSKNHIDHSINCLISGYVRTGLFEKAQDLFDAAPVRDKITWTSMIDGYFNAGDVTKACHLFNLMPDKDAIAWTAMVCGHVQNELFEEAIRFFSEMRSHGVPPLHSTYAILFGASGAMACLDHGRQLHGMLVKSISDFDMILDNSMISMYAKCGEILDAYRVFSNMISRDEVSWNSMIMGLAHHGLVNEALKTFEDMLESGTRPNSVTFLGILSACSHAGLVGQGREFFEMMNDIYKIKPDMEHYVSMINLLGRAGRLKEAEDFILGLPLQGNQAIWGAMLGVCGFGEKNADIAKRAARKLLELDPLNSAAHIVLCNIYAASGQHIEEHKLRKEMGLKGVRKLPGFSWIQINGGVCIFLSGDRLDSRATEMLLFSTSMARDQNTVNLLM